MQTLQGQDTTEKTKTDLKLCDRDGAGEIKPVKEITFIKYNPCRENEQFSPMVLLNCKETRHGTLKTFSFV